MVQTNNFSLENLKTEGAMLLVDKPLNWTSFDVVNKLRFKLREITGDRKIKVGHAGTLDPLATGLLIVCVGKKTKEIDSFMGLDKTYTGTFTFGMSTPSFDAETQPNLFAPTEHLTIELFKEKIKLFLGDIQQMPPQYSAIKVDGEALYKSARLGVEVKVEPRNVRINSFEISNFESNKVDFEVECAKGTYIRSLANDFGLACNSRAYLTKLVRTKIGGYENKNAFSVEKWLEILSDR